MNVRNTSRRMRLGILFLLVAVVAAGVAAVPASAADTPTTLTVSALARTIVYGNSTVLTATLATAEDPPLALGGQWVDVYYGPSVTGPWTQLASVTTDAAQYTTGQYAAAIAPQVNTWYLFRFVAAGGYAARDSNVLAIHVKPALGAPTCPKTVTHGKQFTVKGTLRPHFTAGAKTVKVKAYKLNSHKRWVLYKSYWAKNYDYKGYTRYKVSLTLAKKGSYKFKAQTAATAKFAAASSAFSAKLRVK